MCLWDIKEEDAVFLGLPLCECLAPIAARPGALEGGFAQPLVSYRWSRKLSMNDLTSRSFRGSSSRSVRPASS